MLRALVVDDSPTARALLVAILRDDDGVTVVGEAGSGGEAVQMTAQLRPDVVTMDIHMPGMDGFEATKQIMIDTPTPIVIVSASTMVDEFAAGMRALRAGALTMLRKPPGPDSADYERARVEMVETVKSMADVKVVRHFRAADATTDAASGRPVRGQAPPTAGGTITAASDKTAADSDSTRPVIAAGVRPMRGVVALAASTGGPPAIQQVLAGLPMDFPLPILVVQHIAKGFSQGLAQWLDSTVGLPVRIAAAGDRLLAGVVYIAPEEGHLGVTAAGLIEISSAPPITGFRPSATYLFNSVAGVYRDAALAVIMTGMGSDGLAGLRSVKQCGGSVIAQDEASSVVFGMPGAAVSAKVVDAIIGLDQIAGWIQQFVLRRRNR